jgi:death-on-curing protein
MKPYLFVIFMSLDDVIRIHDMVINRFGGRPDIHDQKLLESAVNHLWMIIEFGSEEDHEIYNLAAVYFYHLIKNHPFVDGNKRTGLMTTLEFFYRNGFESTPHFEDLYEVLYQLAIDTAASRVKKEDIASFFKKIMKKTR